jgi:hypothetical protein
MLTASGLGAACQLCPSCVNHQIVTMNTLGAIEADNGRRILTALVRGLLLYKGDILFGNRTGECGVHT